MSNDLLNKVSLITGGCGLLGQEHCKALLEKGAIVYSGDINLSKSDRFLNETNYRQVYLDVTSEKSIKSILKQILDQENRVDILINNAAIDSKVEKKSSLEFSRLENFSLLQWNKEIEVGLTGAFLCSKVFGSHFAQNGGGVILNIASDLSVISPDQRLYLRDKNCEKKNQPVKPITYSVIKSALVGLTKYLSTYWLDGNVRANALSPGGVFLDQPPEFVKKIEKLIPMGRMANIDEYKAAIQFLCSDDSRYMTGQNIIIDGGRSVW
tara:strand:+ start:552 stop:1352 length:801 start_codon:yes stop_codon:yes gene_type:complete